jgi:hypothetical protein
MKHLLTGLVFLVSVTAQAQDSLKVLFLGNSYTHVNNLPQLVSQVAASTGDYVNYNSYAPGGYTLQQHSSDATALSMLSQLPWDYVVLQEQSQRPSFPIGQVQSDVYPYAKKLDSLINAANPCAETVFYNTWGRKNGDAANCANFPPLCTYQGMDSLLQLRYGYMADTNNAILSPVAQVWRYIRTNYPGIELYNPDESHPSVAGSYAAACAFYTVLFRKNPLQITFNSSLDSTTAANIRLAAKLIAFDNLADWHVGEYDPVADFYVEQFPGDGAYFINQSLDADYYEWYTNGTLADTTNGFYLAPGTPGTIEVMLLAYRCGRIDTATAIVSALNTFEQLPQYITLYPNPFTDNVTISQETIQQPVNWQLLNAVGQVVQVGNTYSITGLQNLPLGLYLLRLNVGDKAYNKPLLKQ